MPRLFLNSTVVESGERAIASDVRIDTRAFPNARDQQHELDAKLRLSTAAHNSARFPFVNAIGSLSPGPGKEADGCLRSRSMVRRRPRPQAASAPAGVQLVGRASTCLHLADGGYFDNSGAQTSQDIVRALARLLDASRGRRRARVSQAQRAMLAWLDRDCS